MQFREKDVIKNRHLGVPTMIREMKKYGLPEPEFYEERDSFKVIFRNNSVAHNVHQSDTQSDTQSDVQIHNESTSSQELISKILKYCTEPKTAKEIRNYIGMSSKRYVAANIIKPLVDSKQLDYTNKNSINAKNQKYVTVNNEKTEN